MEVEVVVRRIEGGEGGQLQALFPWLLSLFSPVSATKPRPDGLCVLHFKKNLVAPAANMVSMYAQIVDSPSPAGVSQSQLDLSKVRSNHEQS